MEEQVLAMNSGATAPDWGSVDLTVLPTITAAKGGTGQTSYTAGDIVYASGTTAVSKLGVGTALQGLQTNSGATAPEWVNSPQSLMTAAGDILYASGANTLAKLAKGSNDEVLTLAAGVPSWASAAGGGAWTLIETQTASTDDYITFSTLSTDYRDFRIIASAIVPETDASSLYFQISSASAFVTSGYTWAALGSNEDNSQSTIGSGSAAHVQIDSVSVGNVSGENIYFELTIENVHSTANQKVMIWESSNATSANKFQQMRGGGRNAGTVAAIDGLRFFFSADAVLSGTATLYGRSNT